MLLPFAALIFAATAQQRQVAITIDDIPHVGPAAGGTSLQAYEASTRKLLAALRGVPITGLVNAGRASEIGDDGLQALLRLWVDAGAVLGNHTHTHPDLNRTPLDRYTADIVRGEPAIEVATGRKTVYFRHPFLHAGPTIEIKRGLETFLASRGYRVAPVTIDNQEWMFAAVYARAVERDPALATRVREAYLPYMESIFEFFEKRAVQVAGREIPQVLLIHANRLNADTMPALLAMMRRRGYHFISLESALKDPVYQLPDTYAGRDGFSWIHRWAVTQGMPLVREPAEPGWLAAELRRLQP